MGRGNTIEVVQNRILGEFSSISKQAGNIRSEEDEFNKLPLSERIRIVEQRYIKQKMARIKDNQAALLDKSAVRDSWWSLGSDIRERKMLEQRALLK